MFTGIIEEKGIIRQIFASASGGKIVVICKKILEGTRIGDSIAVNGICLTVTALSDDSFTADIMGETIEKTSLAGLKKGDPVNLERALCLNSRLGGHIVSGHIDGTGQISEIRDNGIAILIRVSADRYITRGIVPKGSIAIDGISLTVVEVGDEYFTVSLIPHTVAETNLQKKHIGDMVNLETDVIGKYAAKLLEEKEMDSNKGSISETLLRENGFF